LANENTAVSQNPQIEDYFLFQANKTYVFFVSTTSASASNFALGIYDSKATGDLAGAFTWNPISQGSSSPYTCTPSGTTGIPYAKYSWTQSTSGLFDVAAGFAQYQNSSSDYWGFSTYIAIFRGNVSDATLTGNNLCTATASALIVAFEESALAAHQYGLQFTAGQIYTVVASGSQTNDYGDFGIFVAPTRVEPAVFLQVGFVQPSVSQSTCENGFYSNQSFAGASFTAGPSTFTVLVGVAYAYSAGNTNWTYFNDNNMFFYQGNNTGSSTAAPVTCPQAGATYLSSTGSDTYSLTTVPGQVYSVVVSGIVDSGYNAYLVYVLTGTPVGNVNTSTGSSSTTGGQSTNGAATNGGGIANAGHGGSTTNFTAPTTTNAGSAVVCSIVFVVLAILSLLL